MEYGDLVYIPQDVNVFNYNRFGPMTVLKTDKPVTALFLGEENVHVCQIFIKGRKASVDKKYVYPMEKNNVS